MKLSPLDPGPFGKRLDEVVVQVEGTTYLRARTQDIAGRVWRAPHRDPKLNGNNWMPEHPPTRDRWEVLYEGQ